jgi:hypothetical protein
MGSKSMLFFIKWGKINLSFKEMGNKLKHKMVSSLAGAVALFVTSLITAMAPVYAASANMYLSASGSTAQGGTLSISIRENSGSEPVNAASATITYPTGSLQYLSTSNSSAFGIAAATSGGGGSAHVERGSLSPVTGAQTVAIVYFRVLANSGSASIAFSSGQVLSANSNANIASSYSGTTVHLTAPVAAPVAPPADTIPPKITDVKASNITASSVVITWTTSEPASSSVDYGPTKDYGLSTSDGTLITAHKIVLNSSLIVPAQQYHYAVKSADAAGNAASSPDSTFTTQGAKVVVSVRDQKNKPVKGAKVSLLDSSAITDKNGKATVTGATVGKQTLVVDYKSHIYTQTVTVKPPDPKNTPQPLAAKITTKSGLLLPFILILVLISVISWLLGKGGDGLKGFIDEVRALIPGSKGHSTTGANATNGTPPKNIVKPS